MDDPTAVPVDGGDGSASVVLNKATQAVVAKLAARTLSDPSADPETGADLGAGPGAGLITGEDMGAAADIKDAAKKAKAM